MPPHSEPQARPAPAPVIEGQEVWRPGTDRIERAQITRFLAWLRETRGREFADIEALWRWSVSDADGFWRAIWDYFDVAADGDWSRAVEATVPGEPIFRARWFAGARANYAEHLLRREAEAAPDETALIHASELRPLARTTWAELGGQVRRLAQALRARGVGPGDRVVSYMPNVPETVVAMLATVAIGAVWSSAAPEFGPRTVVQRFGQIAPKVAFLADGYSFNGRIFERGREAQEILDALPEVELVVELPYIDRPMDLRTKATRASWEEMLAGPPVAREDFAFARVPHDHPLWILFSSGTTGVPKAICHSHLGMIAEHLKVMTLHIDLSPGKRMFFYTTTGWMMWNAVVSALICGAGAVLYDGSPTHGGVEALWRLAEATRATHFGASPTLIKSMQAAGVRPGRDFDLSSLESILLGGSPATPEDYRWLLAEVGEDVWINGQSGGTDMCGGIAVGMPVLPVTAGRMQCRVLGMDAHVFDEAGREVVDAPGELVLTGPFPSAPLGFWGDPEGRRYHDSYFSTYPGVWRHGDLARLAPDGRVAIYGRSDATLNRYGVRIGTAEIYGVLDELPGVTDALVVCCETRGAGYYMPLFVSLAPGVALDEALTAEIAARLRRQASPRHVPDEIHAVPAIPYTLTGKKMEIPVRRILAGARAAEVSSPDAMADPAALDWFTDFAARPEIQERFASAEG